MARALRATRWTESNHGVPLATKGSPCARWRPDPRLTVAVGVSRLQGEIGYAHWHRVLWAVLGIYALWAADLLFFPLLLDARLRETVGDITGNLGWVNPVPFATLSAQLGGIPSVALRQIGGNVGLLLPLGLIGPVLMPSLRRVCRLALVALCVSVAIELIQLAGTLTGFIERSVDVDDLVLNVVGALIGWLVWRAASAAWSVAGHLRAAKSSSGPVQQGHRAERQKVNC